MAANTMTRPTHTQELLAALYEEMRKENPIVSIFEVQAEFNKRYGAVPTQ